MFSFGPSPTRAKKAWSSSTCLLYARYCTVKITPKSGWLKSLAHKIPSSAECQNYHSVDTLVAGQTLLLGEGGGGRGAESYDREKAWPSINHTILSGRPPLAAISQYSVRCFKLIWKVGKVDMEGLIMPTWNQLWLPVHCGILAISWQDFLPRQHLIWLEENW